MSDAIALPDDAVRAMMRRAMNRSLVLVGPLLDAAHPAVRRAMMGDLSDRAAMALALMPAAGMAVAPAHVTVFAMARLSGVRPADPSGVTVDWCIRHDTVRAAVTGLPDALNTPHRRPILLGGDGRAAREAMMVVDDALVRAAVGLDRRITAHPSPCDDGCGAGLAIDMRGAWPVRLG